MLYTIHSPTGSHSYRGIQPVEGIDPLSVGSLLAFVEVVSGKPEVWLLQDEAALSELRRYYRERPEGPCSHVGAILARVTTDLPRFDRAIAAPDLGTDESSPRTSK
jgi:hypothetical protein